MTLIDANLLIYAFREDSTHHTIAHAWLEQKRQRAEPILLHPLAVAAFLRLVTKNLGPLPASPMTAALDFLAAIQPITPPLLLDDALHLEIFRRLAARHSITGNDSNDLWLAAFVIRHRLTLASADLGFARFQPEIDWINPLVPSS